MPSVQTDPTRVSEESQARYILALGRTLKMQYHIAEILLGLDIIASSNGNSDGSISFRYLPIHLSTYISELRVKTALVLPAEQDCWS